MNTGMKIINSSYLRPDILFYLARLHGIVLELDQTCMIKAMQKYDKKNIPLLLNILPRNLYQIEKIIDKIPKKLSIISFSIPFGLYSLTKIFKHLKISSASCGVTV